MPDLTIITITYNDFDGISKTVVSINENISGSNLDVEVIIVDGCADLCFWSPQMVHLSKQNLKYLNGPDRGIFHAMNKGIRTSSDTGFVFFLNSGDCFYEQNTLRLIDHLLKGSESKIIAGKVQLSYGERVAYTDLKPWVCHQAAFVKVAILKEYEFDETFSFFGDLNLWSQLKRKSLFEPHRIDNTISRFALGGVGNSPNYLWLRYRERSRIKSGLIRVVFRTIRVMYHFSVYKIIGAEAYYKILSKVK